MHQSRFLGAVYCFGSLLTLLGCSSAPRNLHSVGDRLPASLREVPPGADRVTLSPLQLQTQADFYFSKGEMLSNQGQSMEAIESFKMVQIYDQESSRVPLRLAMEYAKVGLGSEAISSAQIAIQKNPENADARILLGQLYSALKMYDRAQSQFRAVLEKDPKNYEAAMLMGAVYAEQKKYDLAMERFTQLGKTEEFDAAHLAWFYVGRLHLELKKAGFEKAAMNAFDESLRIRPKFFEAALAKAAVLSDQKRVSAAREVLVRFQREQGPHPRVAEILYQAYIEEKNLPEAYEQLKVLEQESDDPLGVKLRMALVAFEMKEYQKAESKLQDLVRSAPDNDRVRFYLAAVYDHQDRVDRAIESYLKVPSISRYYVDARMRAGVLLYEQKQTSRSVKELGEAVGLVKDSVRLHLLYARLLSESGKAREGWKHLQSVRELFEKDSDLHFALAGLADELEGKSAALPHLRKAIEYNPNNALALNYLAYTMAELGVDLPEAEGFAKRALEILPQDGHVLDTYGWILFKRNRVAEAIVILEKALRASPEEGVIAEHLGDAYRESRLLGKAKEMYQRAMTFEKDRNRAQALRDKVESVEVQLLRSADQASPSSPSAQAQEPSEQVVKPRSPAATSESHAPADQ